MNKKCPLLKKPCIEHECMFWVHMLGHDPRTDQAVDVHDCTWRWIPALQMETTRQAAHTAAAVEDERNLIHRGLTRQLTRKDFQPQYDDIVDYDDNGQPLLSRLNGEDHGRN